MKLSRYFRLGTGANRIDDGDDGGVCFLLWGEPGPCSIWGCFGFCLSAGLLLQAASALGGYGVNLAFAAFGVASAFAFGLACFRQPRLGGLWGESGRRGIWGCFGFAFGLAHFRESSAWGVWGEPGFCSIWGCFGFCLRPACFRQPSARGGAVRGGNWRIGCLEMAIGGVLFGISPEIRYHQS